MKPIIRELSKREDSFFLLGPRGTGKSTWLKQNYPDAVTLDLLKTEVASPLRANPSRLSGIVSGNAHSTTFVIDEVQLIPELLYEVHALMERYPQRQFILTGSSARKLKRAGTDLLGGRALKMNMHPFTASELGSSFSLEDALRFGLLPVVNAVKDRAARLSAYIGLYLREEIQMEGLVRQLGPFTRFLEAASFSHGGLLTSSEIARDCGVGRTTVDGYLKILYDLMIAFCVPVFSKRAKRELVSHGKFYFFDTGVYRTLRPKGPLDRPSEIDGAALEGLVFQNLRAKLDCQGEDGGLYFWRTVSGKEVDFVVYTENRFEAIEVKNAAKVARSDLSALKSFRTDYPESRQILLYRGELQYEDEGVLIVPIEKWLLNGCSVLEKLKG